MDQDFYKGIEASSMSVEEILREFYAQDEPPAVQAEEPKRPAPRAQAPRRSAPRPEAPGRPEPRVEAARLAAGLRERAGGLMSRLRPAERSAPPARSTRQSRRGPAAETEKTMDFDEELQRRPLEETAGADDELLNMIGELFDDISADAPAEAPETDFAPSGEERSGAEEEISLEDILAEYDSIFAEKPVEQESPDAAEETQLFTPKREKPRPVAAEDRQELADFAAGSKAAISGSAGRGGAVSSMADEARRFIGSLTDEDYDRMAAAPSYSNRDAGAERFNLSGREDKMVFGDKELDLSADENYVPPAQNTAPLYHWTAGEEELPDAPQEEPSFLQKILNFNGSRRKNTKRPLNAPVKKARGSVPAPQAEAEAEEESAEEIAPAFETEEFPAEAAAPASAEKKAAPEDFSFSLDDGSFAPAAYAPEGDYAPEEPAYESFAEESAQAEGPAEPEPAPLTEEEPEPEEEAPFPSFGQYVSSLFMGALYRLRGAGGSAGADTMDTGGEELGPELTPAEASKYYGSFVTSLRMRFRVSLVLLAILAWVSLGLPVSGMLRTVRVAAGMCLALQLTIMLLSLDVLTNAAVNLARLRFGADSLAGLCCVLTCFDALAVALDAFGSPHMPLCLLSSLSLLGVLLSSLLSARGLRKSLRVPSIAKHCSSVRAETGFKDKGLTLLKTERPIAGFVRRSEEAPPDETAFLRAAPALLLLSLLFAAVVSAARHADGDFLYILTALLTPAVPLTALLCFALPFFVGSNRIFYSGAAVAGWSGMCDVGRSQNLIVTDRDLFPEGSVEIDTVRIFADAAPEKILSYAGTMILASGSGLAPCFAELLNRNGGSMRQVENFELLSGGGMKGIIDGETVLCGGTELMRLMNVQLPYRLVDKTTVLLAVDGMLYGIFNMKYTAQPQVRKALVGLIRSSRHPVFAIRDFNVNPEMLRELFDVATDGYDFPPYLERFELSEAPAGSEAPVAAVICREGLGPLSQMADTGRGMYLAARFNLVVTLAAALIGVFAVFLRFMNLGQVGLVFLLLYLILWALPVAAASLLLKF